ncbi:hypothetical protein SEA_IZZY_73 [Streptomyces phage Izzy]|uniref:Uncharacterized protein n=7 Tax=Likavirus TaxID=1982880 RepID=A0A2U8UTZ1_9CAUD|nr:hypothetical protein AVT27_gp73 [Streptomyces phage Izzy]YP_009616572.1 hypothetical protein FDI81_gp74 [Streptomyces phage Hydra]ATE85024.1 hypothetical protein SEA_BRYANRECYCLES_73 [Streptomyces phage BryanRecycles]ATE85327.1 hypothetical protein SEA_JASH_73 [Streptomyces phage Jash]ATE85475.1 hypothetical protein SEA_OZZIE_71 [Streptomyces phage Ozzie]AWN07517.1 hypothetical protein SEA_EDDASA_74 [Streptomyces phage Eddasa]QDK04004.1 hypothetical protein SEA_RUSTICUS_73 [Streptomyces ph
MKKWTKRLGVGFLIAALAGAVIDSNETAKAAPQPVKPKVSYVAPKLPTKPCPDDDSESKDCYWDAAQQGNGKGYSYWVDRNGKVTYLNPKLNDPIKRKAFVLAKKKAGWDYWGVVWGHRLCYAKVGDTSYIHCFDGFRETS